MTKSQSNLYWRLWGRAAAVAGWKPNSPPVDPDKLTDMARRVQSLCAAAVQPGRNPSADLLRHACHVVAIGRPKSSKQLTNADLDRVLLVFKLIIDGDDLASVIALEDPDQGAVKRLTWSIRQVAPEALTVKICRDKFARADWESLGAPELLQLLMTVKRVVQRQEIRAAAVASLSNEES